MNSQATLTNNSVQTIKLLNGKKGLILGVANKLSLGWGIAECADAHGAQLGFTYVGDAIEKRVRPLAEELKSDFIEPCDVTDEESMDRLFATVKERWGKLDFLVHSVAFSDKNELRGRFVDTTLSNFVTTMNISCYSLVALAKRAESLMTEGGSILTLTYFGSERVIPCYNVMGVAKAALEASVRYLAADMGPKNIRVNAISAGPVKTLAASAIGDFKAMLKVHSETSPLRRNTTSEDVGKSAVYLLSDMASGVTGEIHYVDSGYNITGMSLPNQATNNQE